MQKESIWLRLFGTTKDKSEHFTALREIPSTVIFEGVYAKELFGEGKTAAYIELDPNVKVPLHKHEYAQAGVVLEGEIKIRIGEELKKVRRGDLYFIPPNILHGAENLKEFTKIIELYFF